MSRDSLREVDLESRWEAAPAVALLIAMQVAVALASRDQHWQLWQFGWWIWLIPVPPEVGLLVPLGVQGPRHWLRELGVVRETVIGLLLLVSLANAFLVLSVIASLIAGTERSGAQLLLKAGGVWLTNVVAFGLWYWIFDRGGPVRRYEPDPPLPDFQFPQLENPQLGPPDWQPSLIDYVYVSFTNSIAFSPTDAMPLTRWAKVLMLFESALSSLTILLVAARAVNIFK